MIKDKETQLLETIKKMEELREETKALQPHLDELLAGVGIDNMLQDPETLLVYKVVKPKGRYTEYFDIGYTRTKKPEERSGTLSKKEAEAANYVLSK